MNDETQQAMVKHTPIPWRMVPSRNTGQEIIVADSGHPIAVMIDYNSFGNIPKEDRNFILRAVNCHDELLAACRDAEIVICNAEPPQSDGSLLRSVQDVVAGINYAIAKAESKPTC